MQWLCVTTTTHILLALINVFKSNNVHKTERDDAGENAPPT